VGLFLRVSNESWANFNVPHAIGFKAQKIEHKSARLCRNGDGHQRVHELIVFIGCTTFPTTWEAQFQTFSLQVHSAGTGSWYQTVSVKLWSRLVLCILYVHRHHHLSNIMQMAVHIQCVTLFKLE
jgi:hypothetical protein